MNCSKTDGMCNCKRGWEGSNCETDINECLNVTICQDNSQCQNTNGSNSNPLELFDSPIQTSPDLMYPSLHTQM
jgi:hypothetical protein